MSGGDFVEGAKQGAWTSAIGEIVGGTIQKAADHLSRNIEQDNYLNDKNLYDNKDITLDEAKGFLKQASDFESQLHQNGPGNESNIKLTSKIASEESWWQKNWSNRYGKYELILRPNRNGTYQHVTEQINVGTLNRGNNPVSHFYRDMIPYWMLGN
jgi:hypothetical protein